MAKIKDFIAETRLPFISASLVPVFLGTAYGYYQGGVFSFWLFLLALLAIGFLHLGANVLNDYYDWKMGTDNVNTTFVRPFTGGSRMIQNGVLTPPQVLVEGIVLLAIGMILGAFLIWETGWVILALGVAGVFLGVFHSAPPLKLHSRSLGELGVGLAFGVLPVAGAFYLQVRVLSWDLVLVSIPIAFLVAGVLFVNGFQDREADRSTGKITLTVRLGKQAPLFLAFLLFFPFVWVVALVAQGILPYSTLIVFAFLPLAYQGAEFSFRFSQDPFRMVPANASVVNLHLFFGVVYSLAIIFRNGWVVWVLLGLALVLSIKILLKIRNASSS